MNMLQLAAGRILRASMIGCLIITISSNINSSSVYKFDEEDLYRPNLAEAIHEANINPGVDSLYVSNLNFYFSGSDLSKLNIEDHLVLINDVQSQHNQITEGLELNITDMGHLELQGFDLSNLSSKMKNQGMVTLKDCHFAEGRDLTQFIHNDGAFTIKHGIFIGDASGPIIRDAEFRIGSYIIL